MSHRPYKKTLIGRITMPQEIRVLLPPELEAPEGSWRKVQIVLPGSPSVFLGLDIDPQTLGLNRSYKLAKMSSSVPLVFVLTPEQFIIGGSDIGIAYASIVVQYLTGEP